MSSNPTTAGASVQARWRAEAETLRREVRQAFLDAVWGGKTIGEATEIAGITFDQAMGTIGMNIVRRHETVLNLEAV